MLKSTFPVALITGAALGISVLLALDVPMPSVLGAQAEPLEAESTQQPRQAAGASSTTDLVAASVATRQTPTGSPQDTGPLSVAVGRGEDLADVLLLYDASQRRDFDVNFCRIATYYGLLCRELDLRSTDLGEDQLRDARGSYFGLIGISAENLQASGKALSSRELQVLATAVRNHGANLFVSNLRPGMDFTALEEMTGGAILGTVEQTQPSSGWIVSTRAPEATREFTGLTLSVDAPQFLEDHALVLNHTANATVLISVLAKSGEQFPVVASTRAGAGTVFVDSSQARGNIKERFFRSMYYDPLAFSSIVPLMMITRYTLGEEVWHSEQDHANLTIDDPALTEPFGHLTFPGLLGEMEAHNFHTTIAMHPATWTDSQPSVVALFRSHPDRFSLVQHGNNGDGYEFYRYVTSPWEGASDELLPGRPIAEQEADIVEGASRMLNHEILAHVPTARIMIFPWGISPEPTLELLKEHGFWATVNSQDRPLDSPIPNRWDFGMYPAIMDFAGFPLLIRRHPGSYAPFRPSLTPFVYDLFIDKPALFYSHEGELFADGIDTFSHVAEALNGLTGAPEWTSLGDIVRGLYLQKRNDDGSIDVAVYSNKVTISNNYSEPQVFHITKQEELGARIEAVELNGQDWPYRLEDGVLKLEFGLTSGSSAELTVSYEGQLG